MRRQGNLIAKIADIDNLRLALWKARLGKIAKRNVWRFHQHWNEKLLNLGEEILKGEVSVGKYHFFTIYDPKERRICAADFRERVLHHAIMNVCHERFEQFQIYDSYASRKGKGTYAAIDRARHFCKRYRFFLKLDVRKYFEQIPHDVLNAQLQRLFKDIKLLQIFDQIIDSSYINCEARGVPIGNLTSQYFANHYLAVADHYIKEQLRIGGYVRYMDDMVLWHDDKNELLKAGKALQLFLSEQLNLQLKPFCLHTCALGLPFLGYLLYPNATVLARKSRLRFARKLQKYENSLATNLYTQADYQRHVQPLLAFAEKAYSYSFRRKIIARYAR